MQGTTEIFNWMCSILAVLNGLKSRKKSTKSTKKSAVKNTLACPLSSEDSVLFAALKSCRTDWQENIGFGHTMWLLIKYFMNSVLSNRPLLHRWLKSQEWDPIVSSAMEIYFWRYFSSIRRRVSTDGLRNIVERPIIRLKFDLIGCVFNL